MNMDFEITPELAQKYRTYEIYRMPVSRNGIISTTKEKCIYTITAMKNAAKEAFEAFKKAMAADPNWYYELRVIWIYRGHSHVDVVTSWCPYGQVV